jgi:hypothetical protein
MKKKLHEMVNALIAGREDDASIALSKFFAAKTKLLLHEQEAYDVFLNGKLIDTIFQNSSNDTVADVKKSLVDHDGYDSGIVVKKAKSKKKLKEGALNEDAYFDRVIKNVVDHYLDGSEFGEDFDPTDWVSFVQSPDFVKDVYKYVLGRYGSSNTMGDRAMQNLASILIRKDVTERFKGIKGHGRYRGGEERPESMHPNYRSDDTAERDGPQYYDDER